MRPSIVHLIARRRPSSDIATHINKVEPAGVKHLGPVAQDFYSAFGSVDESGVALAAIQGLNQKLDEKDAEIRQLKSHNDAPATRLAELEQTVRELAHAR